MNEKTLDLSFKNLSSLPTSLSGYTGINLAGNNFQKEQLQLAGTDLQYISLAYNNLQKLWQLPKELKKLEINNNLITQLQPLPRSLLELDFSNNLLTNITPLMELQNLQYLFLKNNKIKSIQGLSVLKCLKELDVECNELNSIQDFLQFEGHTQLSLLGVHGNIIFDLCLTQRRKLSILPILESNICILKRLVYTYQNSTLFRKKKELIENDIDFFQDLEEQPKHQNTSKLPPEFNISQLFASKADHKHMVIDTLMSGDESTQLERQRKVDHIGTKSLSPINQKEKKLQEQSVQFFLPETNKYKSFQEVFRNTKNPSPLNFLSNLKGSTKSKLNSDSDCQVTDLKCSNQTLIQQKFKLQQQLQQSIKQNETFYGEIQSYKTQLQKILGLLNPQILFESQVEQINMHTLLDSVHSQVERYQQTMQDNNTKLMNNFMQRINKKVRLVCNEIQEQVQDKISGFNRKVLRVEKFIEEIAQLAACKNLVLESRKALSLHCHIKPPTQQLQIARHDKHNSDLTQPNSVRAFKSDNLFLKSTFKIFDHGIALSKGKTSQELESIRSKIKNLEGHIEHQFTEQ